MIIWAHNSYLRLNIVATSPKARPQTQLWTGSSCRETAAFKMVAEKGDKSNAHAVQRNQCRCKICRSHGSLHPSWCLSDTLISREASPETNSRKSQKFILRWTQPPRLNKPRKYLREHWSGWRISSLSCSIFRLTWSNSRLLLSLSWLKDSYFFVRQICECLCLFFFFLIHQQNFCTEGPIILSPLKSLVQSERSSTRMNQYHFDPKRGSSVDLVYVCLVFMKYRGSGKYIAGDTCYKLVLLPSR